MESKTLESKTLDEWFDTLPEEIRDKAKNNTTVSLELKQEGLSAALVCAFDWGDSEEGNSYWLDVFLKN